MSVFPRKSRSLCQTARTFAFVLGVLSVAPAAEAGIIVAAGDFTPVFSLTDTFPEPAQPGTQQFFTNILGAGTNVLVLNSPSNDFSGAELHEFYSSLPGVTSTLLSAAATVTAADLAGKDLFLAPGPDDFTAAEIAAISAFVAADGSLFVAGDGAFVPLSFGINDLLAGIGSSLSLGLEGFDIGFQTATGAEIVGNSLTSGVTSLTYGAAVLVSGGNPLFLTNDLQPFMAVEGQAPSVPEPGTLTLLALGLVALARVRIRRD